MKKEIKNQWFMLGWVGLALAVMLFTPVGAGADPVGSNHATGNMRVAVNITPLPNSCNVNARGPVFTAAVGDSGFTLANGTIGVNCSPNDITYVVALNEGQHFNPDLHNRQVVSGGRALHYLLLKPLNDPQQQQGWGDGYGGSRPLQLLPLLPRTGSQVITVVGQLYLDPTAPAGDYTDTVVVTVHF